MPGPPPPPPPMPPMGRGAGGPPPPPMPGMKAPGGKKAATGAGRGALLSDIGKGARLKKVTQVNDRSAPTVGKVKDAGGAAIPGAPPIPGMGRPPAVPGLAPPGNRARSNSDTAGDSGAAAPPQLGGIFAGGMPKLRKAGGVNTGAESKTPYQSDPESSRGAAPKPPRGAAPKPPGAPPAPPTPGARPPLNSVGSSARASRTNSMASSKGGKPKPPPPIGKKPPMPPPASRKPSGIAPPPPLASPVRPPPVPGSAPPPLPPPSTPSTPSAAPPPPPPPPPASAPRAPSRSTPQTPKAQEEDYDPYQYEAPTRPPAAPAPPPPKAPPSAHTPSLAETAARNSFGRASPAAPPPPPPAAAPSPPSSILTMPTAPPAAPPSRPTSQTPLRSMQDSSSYTLTNGARASTTNLAAAAGHKGKILPIHDLRWRFQDEGQFPGPREFSNGPKMYRAGRGSSVPLDLSAYD
ncbi:hypothetical protein P153DRAFT_394830 [Dothidotthia symphoricarpi CBS 119687]|uniref:WH2 domain-containing protein n=1 Tax=Dothidotthia symphoricarpi CBS 119687 TaxID=1392245 RepID=A0A6A6ALZ5_9PLEO|nr:uncharacterized protein P153DRAFT_394830 [Dothidotthia symphoricarpi CBS 119687]KAF2131501.1 hypothetical protein P153DRAFT_394830 [Dothidotthia symphoricarpi CBS 119687]